MRRHEGYISYEGNSSSRIAFMPGFGESNDRSLSNFNESLAHLGHEVLAVNHPEVGNTDQLVIELEKLVSTETDPERKRLLSEIRPEIYRKAKAYLSVISETNTQPVHGVGHSLGGLSVATAALIKPELFQDIILLNSAGWTGKNENEPEATSISKKILGIRNDKLDVPLRALFLSSNHLQSLIDAFGWPPNKNWDDTLKHYVFDGRFWNGEFFNEAKAMQNTDILPILNYLSGKGMPISVLIDTHDKTFQDKDMRHRIPSWIQLRVTDGLTHFAPVLHGNEIARLVDELIRENEPHTLQAAE